MSTPVIRELRPTDFDDMVETFFSFFPEVAAEPSFGLSLFREKPSMEDEHKWFASVLRDLKDGNLVIRVAEVGSRVVGSCDVRKIVPGSPLDHRGMLGLAVRKEFRGRGIGTALMKETLEACKGRFEGIELLVLANNRPAIRLYKRFGFRRVGTIPRALKRAGRYFDDDIMYLQLRR